MELQILSLERVPDDRLDFWIVLEHQYPAPLLVDELPPKHPHEVRALDRFRQQIHGIEQTTTALVGRDARDDHRNVFHLRIPFQRPKHFPAVHVGHL